MRRLSNKRPAGFALFEVLVAVSLLSIGCVVLIQALTASSRAFNGLQQRYVAALAVEDSLWFMDNNGGHFDAEQTVKPDGFRAIAWDTQDAPVALDAVQAALTQTSVTLRWNSDLSLRENHQESFTLSNYLRPEDSANSD